MICERCGKDFFEDWRKDKQAVKTPCKFCSRACSNSRVFTQEIKDKISKALKKGSEKNCVNCGASVSYNNKSGICKKCKPPAKTKSELVAVWRKNKKIKLVEYKGGKCEICGYNNCISALEFHHRDPNIKEFGISSKNIRSIEKYYEEIDKCILVCSNCHREIHENISNVPVAQ